jgi:hypothetical protein
MAYLHCHSCTFSQDDFWDWGYNPIRCALQRIRDYARPRFINFDRTFYGPHRFSWMIMLLEIRRVLSRFRGMVYPTEKSFQEARKKFGRRPFCPKCGADNLCID